MKKNGAYFFLGMSFFSYLMGGAVPHYVQTPTSFVSENILSNTSRYFFKKVTANSYMNSPYLLSLQNASGGTSVRILSIAASLVGSVHGNGFYITAHKNSGLSGSYFSPIDAAYSVVYFDTYASSLSGGTQVYELQNYLMISNAYGSFSGNVLKDFVKGEYPLTLAPGDTVSFSVYPNIDGGVFNFIVMWEEIIN